MNNLVVYNVKKKVKYKYYIELQIGVYTVKYNSVQFQWKLRDFIKIYI